MLKRNTRLKRINMSEEDKLLFTPEEISVIDKKLGYLIFNWPKDLIMQIVQKAKNKGVGNLYMNTPETVDGGANDAKTQYFYNTLPAKFGFKKVMKNLRNKGDEPLWLLELDEVKLAKITYELIKMAEERTFTINQVPKSYQGALIQIIGKKPTYLLSEIQKVLQILEEKERKKEKETKSRKGFFYDWESNTWSGGQRFDDTRSEIVLTQRVPDDIQNVITQDPVLLKFWDFLLRQPKHFGGGDVIGFALISVINNKNWVINEIQTDCLNKYMDIRSKYYKEERKAPSKKISWESVKDMLEAQNKSNWIAKAETIPQFKQQLIDNPNIITQLPDNSVDIEKWLADQRRYSQEANRAPTDLMQVFQSINFNKRIFRA